MEKNKYVNPIRKSVRKKMISERGQGIKKVYSGRQYQPA